MAALFEEDAIFVRQPGVVTSGEDVRAATAQFLAMGPADQPHNPFGTA